MREYKVLSKQTYKNAEFKIVPIRHEDRFRIMEWRNEQIYHLRQNEPLTAERQDLYFKTTILSIFNEEKPNQILFSFLKGDECIGYGGLVHINWIDKNAEVSFVMDTKLEKEEFSKNWSEYLYLIEKVAFNELMFRKLYVFAFDLRPHLYSTLEDNSYFLDARLKDHCLFNDKFIDVVIHTKLNEDSNLSR